MFYVRYFQKTERKAKKYIQLLQKPDVSFLLTIKPNASSLLCRTNSSTPDTNRRCCAFENMIGVAYSY